MTARLAVQIQHKIIARLHGMGFEFLYMEPEARLAFHAWLNAVVAAREAGTGAMHAEALADAAEARRRFQRWHT